MAGPYAQLVHVGLPSSKREARWMILFDKGSKDDNERVDLVMNDLWALSRTKPFAKLMNTALDIVQSNWSAIDALAKALLERHILEYDEAFEVAAPYLSPQVIEVARP